MARQAGKVVGSLLVVGIIGALCAASGAGAAVPMATPLSTSPIKHVVVIFQENHTFNDLLGKLCVDEANRCEGTTVGEISDGTQITLGAESDTPPQVGHEYEDVIAAINGGAMNGWDHVRNCGPPKYHCLEQAQAGAVPDLWSLADTFALSDHTFQNDPSSSWGAHLDLIASTMDSFHGDSPFESRGGGAAAGGCDDRSEALWDPPDHSNPIDVPACVPDASGKGPYKKSPVQYVPTLLDRLDAAKRSWNIYAPGPNGAGGYGWSMCPTFYGCLSTKQDDNVRRPQDFAKVASKGKLANVSFVIPTFNESQHNGFSLIKGDNWIAQNVNAVMNGPDWKSTVIFITYDDCGCFYDPVLPTGTTGLRLPMVIVSPYAKPHFVDSNIASFNSMLAFTEHLFKLSPLSSFDGSAYDYSDAFDFNQAPLPPMVLPMHRVPAASIAYMARHPGDPSDQ